MFGGSCFLCVVIPSHARCTEILLGQGAQGKRTGTRQEWEGRHAWVNRSF